jgi:glycerate kinase
MRRVPGVVADELPVADGGEGTAAVLAASLGGVWHEAEVPDPLGRPVRARWLVLPDGVAIVESAAAIGLTLLTPEERNPFDATSWGFGELLGAAVEAGASSVVACVGGTATVDGGAGMLAAIGSRLEGVTLRIACDVRNALLGPRGAARVYGPQKGADPPAIEVLEARLAAMDALRPYAELPGAGSGGGLGAALASLGGELLEGAELVLQLIGFDDRARDASLVVTGEGTVDGTTFDGKAPGAVLRHCIALGVRCELFGGIVRDSPALPLSGDPSLAAEDLAQMGEELALTL